MANEILKIVITIAFGFLVFAATIIIAGFNGIWSRWSNLDKVDHATKIKYGAPNLLTKWKNGWGLARNRLSKFISDVFIIILTCIFFIAIPQELIFPYELINASEYIVISIPILMLIVLYFKLQVIIEKVFGIPEELG